MKNNSEKIKSIVPINCPKCGAKFYTCSIQNPPTPMWILTTEEAEEIKKSFLEEINKLTFPDKKEKEMLRKWLENPDNMFSQEEANEYLEQIKKDIGKNVEDDEYPEEDKEDMEEDEEDIEKNTKNIKKNIKK